MELKKFLPYLAGVFTSLIFGFSFLFTSIGLKMVNPMDLIAYRFSTAALIMTILWAVGFIKLSYRGKNLSGVILLSLCEPVIYFICETYGIKNTTSSLSGLMIALIPVVVTIFASIYLKERTNFYQILFIILSIAGVAVIVLLDGYEGGVSRPVGFVFLLGAVISAGSYSVLSRKLSESFTPFEITFVMMWIGAIFFNAVDIIQRINNNTLMGYLKDINNYNVIIPVVYLGVLSSVIAYILHNFMLAKLPASQAAVFANLTTIVSVFAGIFINHESFYWFHILGGIMILAGVWGTNYYGRSERNIKERVRHKLNKPQFMLKNIKIKG
ncbi:MAG TPA: EamA family transporter [Clostridiaceae bacterium]|nr:EamA family transporter [Clostridiaceae bacterium]